MNVTEQNDDYFYARHYAYDLLRRLFMEEPTAELMNYLQQNNGFEFFPVDNGLPSVNDAIAAIKRYLTEHHFKAGEGDFENLHWDFTRLFIGPETPPAPPWESVYVSRDKLLFQQHTLDVKRYYDHYGFSLKQDETEAADHIGFELEFIYLLSSQAIALLEAHPNDRAEFNELTKAQLNFLQRHILAFSGEFTFNIHLHAQTDFYRALSTIFQQFLLQDERMLNRYLSENENQ